VRDNNQCTAGHCEVKNHHLDVVPGQGSGASPLCCHHRHLLADYGTMLESLHITGVNSGTFHLVATFHALRTL
jgi:hypothetical protein